MPLSVDFLVCKVSSVKDAPSAVVPMTALIAFFQVWDITVRFFDGPPLPFEPTLIQSSVDSLLTKYRPTDAGASAPVVLVIGREYFPDPGTNGLLLDLGNRGACEIFTESDQFRSAGEEERFQIYAHEIGHVINLTHADATQEYPSAMDQWDRRKTGANKSKIWELCKHNAPPSVQARLGQYVANSATPTPGLPLSPASIFFLGNAQLEQVRPWGRPFRDAGEGANADRPHGGATLQLTLDRYEIGLGEPLDFSLRLTLDKHAGETEINGPLGLKFQTMEVRIEMPSGQTHNCCSRLLACTSTRHRLRPGKTIIKHCSMLTDRHKLLFDQTGLHYVTVRIPGLRTEARAEVSVHEPAHPSFGRKAFQRFLIEGLPNASSRHWRTLDQIIADANMPIALRAHLAEFRLMKRPRARRSRELFQALGTSRLPARLSERVAQADAVKVNRK